MPNIFSSTILAISLFFLLKLSQLYPITFEIKKNDNIENLQSFLITHNYTSKKILANGSHILKYYLNYNNIENLNSLSQKNPKFFQRENYQYVNIEHKLKNRIYDIIIISSNSDFNKNSYKKLINFGYKEYKIEGFRIYISLTTLN
jgi:hypothetical protein